MALVPAPWATAGSALVPSVPVAESRVIFEAFVIATVIQLIGAVAVFAGFALYEDMRTRRRLK
jgi:hypothetical protein